MSHERIKLGEVAPEIYQTVIQMEKQIYKYCVDAGIEQGMIHLLKLRASQLNGCSYCVRLHTRDALTSGESNDRIALVAAWRESDYFDSKERAALALMEAVTLIADGNVPDEVYDAAAKVLSDKELAAVEWLAIMINIWNRSAVASRVTVAP